MKSQTPQLYFSQDYMQNVHGKEIDLLRTTVKVPGKRPPRAVATVAPTTSPKTNGMTKDRSALQLGIGSAGTNPSSPHGFQTSQRHLIVFRTTRPPTMGLA